VAWSPCTPSACAPFAHFPEVSQYQIRHDQASLQVRVVLRPSAPRDTLDRVHAAISHELQAAGALPPPIQVTPVPELQRDRGHGAKLKLIQTTATKGPAGATPARL
jgi:hypothetical protein